MPSNPGTSTRLTERERYIACERLRIEHKADPNEQVTGKHVKKAIFNINNYVCAGIFFCINITVQGTSVQTSSPAIANPIRSFGFHTYRAL